jgi:hypothetical protein
MAFELTDLMETISDIVFRRSVIAFVCRPEIAQRVRDIQATADMPSLGLFSAQIPGVEALTDNEQPEPCLAFFDRDALREYLARNRTCATFGCGSRGVRWYDNASENFYCEACANKITAASPNLPGFNDCQFVKI